MSCQSAIGIDGHCCDPGDDIRYSVPVHAHAQVSRRWSTVSMFLGLVGQQGGAAKLVLDSLQLLLVVRVSPLQAGVV